MSRILKKRKDRMQGLLLVPLILGDGIPPIWHPARSGTHVLVVGENCRTVLDVALEKNSPEAQALARADIGRQTG